MRLAESVAIGARREPEVETRMLRAFDAGAEDLLSCRGVLIGTPENFGYMSGAIKDFFDRTYDQVREHQLNLPYALFVSAGNDGSGAVREVDRIVKGYPMRRVAEAVIVKGEPAEADLRACETLGETMAVGLSMGIF